MRKSQQLWCFAVSSCLNVCASFGALAADPSATFNPLSQTTDPSTLAVAPVFDFDTDSCLPAVAISDNVANTRAAGIKPSKGSITSGCRDPSFMNSSNTYHRKVCAAPSTGSPDKVFCVRMFALYFQKDQSTTTGSGHRNDWEYALIWQENDNVTHASYSAHGKLYTSEISKLPLDPTTHTVKFFYYKDGGGTHALRFAKKGETNPENPTKTWVTPAIADWQKMSSSALTTEQLQADFNDLSYGKANTPFAKRFVGEISKHIPKGYPGKSAWTSEI